MLIYCSQAAKVEIVIMRTLLTILIIIATESSQAQTGPCQENLGLLRQDLISMLNKIPAMPPIAQIYSSVKDLYEQAKNAADRGDYQSCISKTELALKYSRPYGNR